VSICVYDNMAVVHYSNVFIQIVAAASPDKLNSNMGTWDAWCSWGTWAHGPMGSMGPMGPMASMGPMGQGRQTDWRTDGRADVAVALIFAIPPRTVWSITNLLPYVEIKEHVEKFFPHSSKIIVFDH
jgi:hypothetical protein